MHHSSRTVALPILVSVLPINVMACHKMLVLCGNTYVQRLWCAWELFTLFSFQAHSVACEKLELVIIENDAADDGGRDQVEAADLLTTGSPLQTLATFGGF